MLIESMDHPDPAIRLASLSALRRLTKKDLGTNPADWRRELKPVLEASGSPGTNRETNPAEVAAAPAASQLSSPR
jgi:hypothetical protein